MAEGGKVIADSEVPAAEIPNLENHAGRTEIMLTQTREIATIIRYSGTIRKDLIYTAKRVPKIAGIPAGVLRIAAPLSPGERTAGPPQVHFSILSLLLVFPCYGGPQLSVDPPDKQAARRDDRNRRGYQFKRL